MPQSTSPDTADKGKARATGIAGLIQKSPPPPTFSLPSLDAACEETAELWPQRVSPNTQYIPWLCNHNSPAEIGLHAETGEQLGTLLLELIEWLLIGHGTGDKFNPPPDTSLVTSMDKIPETLLIPVAGNTTYYM